MTWSPEDRTVELGCGKLVAERQCIPCFGAGALQRRDPISGRALPELVKQIDEPWRRRWLKERGYTDHQIAPCPHCQGMGWIRRDS